MGDPAVKTERITFLGSPRLKSNLLKEAKKKGISLSQLIRQRCERKPEEDEQILGELIKEIQKSTTQAGISLEKGLSDAQKVLHDLRNVA